MLVFLCTPLAKTIGISNTLVITKQLTINGGSFITLSGGTNTRIIDINGGGTLTLTNNRLVDGQAGTGGVRPQGPVCDSGAFEFVEATLRVFLPIILR